MTKDWTFDQPLDEKTATSSTEERAKIAALFNKEKQQENEEVDYVTDFKKSQMQSKEKVDSESETETETQNQSVPHKTSTSTITNDYKQHLADVMAQNKEDMIQSKKKIEELHQLIDDKNKQNKKLQAISVAIDDL